MQEASYCPTGVLVNDPFAGLSSVLISTYRWFYRWWRQTGDVHASTPYIAMKQGVTERTVYRRLSALRRAGVLVSDVTPGVERRLRPLLPPPPKPRCQLVARVRKSTTSAPIVSGVDVRGMSGVTPYRDSSDAFTQEDTTIPVAGAVPGSSVSGVLRGEVGQEGAASAAEELVRAVVGVGVLPSTAQKLVRVHGADTVRHQLAALDLRNARDKAAVLVKSIRESWSIPAAVQKVEEKRQEDRQKAQERSLRAAVERKRQEERQRLLERFRELPEPHRSELLARAARDAAQESPGAFAMLSGRSGFVPWITERALVLLQGSPDA